MTALMLTPEEVVRLTGRIRVRAQSRELMRMGISHRVNCADEVIVARALAERFLGVRPAQEKREPDLGWRAMGRLGMVSPRGEATKAR